MENQRVTEDQWRQVKETQEEWTRRKAEWIEERKKESQERGNRMETRSVKVGRKDSSRGKLAKEKGLGERWREGSTGGKRKKELEVEWSRTRKRVDSEWKRVREKRRKSRRHRKRRGKRSTGSSEKTRDPGTRLETGREEWQEHVVRVGTGYRVRQDERNPQRRHFDVGYADRKDYRRKEGRVGKVDGTNMGRRIRGKGKDARVKVINAVSAREKRRPVSEYTGSGIRRKSQVGKRKLKPTKPQAKQ